MIYDVFHLLSWLQLVEAQKTPRWPGMICCVGHVFGCRLTPAAGFNELFNGVFNGDVVPSFESVGYILTYWHRTTDRLARVGEKPSRQSKLKRRPLTVNSNQWSQNMNEFQTLIETRETVTNNGPTANDNRIIVQEKLRSWNDMIIW